VGELLLHTHSGMSAQLKVITDADEEPPEFAVALEEIYQVLHAPPLCLPPPVLPALRLGL
jgi:hypothetical protein